MVDIIRTGISPMPQSWAWHVPDVSNRFTPMNGLPSAAVNRAPPSTGIR